MKLCDFAANFRILSLEIWGLRFSDADFRVGLRFSGVDFLVLGFQVGIGFSEVHF